MGKFGEKIEGLWGNVGCRKASAVKHLVALLCIEDKSTLQHALTGSEATGGS